VTDATALADATHIVLPGVGAFADCMHGLNALPGMRDALEEKVLRGGTPFLGICVGMQMLFERGHEHGTHKGLGWLTGEVRAIAPIDPTLKIPHMGWNRLRLRHHHLSVEATRESPLPQRGRGTPQVRPLQQLAAFALKFEFVGVK
jgi:glutamine amidotransferase